MLYLLAFVVGMIIMDIMWAVRLGIPQLMWARYKLGRALRRQQKEEADGRI